MKLRKATMVDAENLFLLNNDPIVRNNSIHPEYIEWNKHLKWLEKKIDDPDTIFFVAEIEDEFAGEVRFEKKWLMTIALVERFRNKGLSSVLIKESLSKVDFSVAAQIKNDNVPSLKVFEKAGFKEIRNDMDDSQ